MDNYDPTLHELKLLNANIGLLQAQLLQVLTIIGPHPDEDLYMRQLDTGLKSMESALDHIKHTSETRD